MKPVVRNSMPSGDVDLLATLDNRRRVTLLDWVDMQEELRAIFGREVDLLSRRETILRETKAIYGEVDVLTVWDTVQKHLPSLVGEIRKLLPPS